MLPSFGFSLCFSQSHSNTARPSTAQRRYPPRTTVKAFPKSRIPSQPRFPRSLLDPSAVRVDRAEAGPRGLLCSCQTGFATARKTQHRYRFHVPVSSTSSRLSASPKNEVMWKRCGAKIIENKKFWGQSECSALPSIRRDSVPLLFFVRASLVSTIWICKWEIRSRKWRLVFQFTMGIRGKSSDVPCTWRHVCSINISLLSLGVCCFLPAARSFDGLDLTLSVTNRNPNEPFGSSVGWKCSKERCLGW